MQSWNLIVPPPDPPSSLDDSLPETVDLLASLLDGPRAQARERARSLLSDRDLLALARTAPGELAESFGLGARDCGRIAAVLQLARRLRSGKLAKHPTLRTARRVHEVLRGRMLGLEQETFLALHLDGKHRLRATRLVSVGTLTTSIVHPREVFREAVRGAAAALIVAHNHPSGDPEPSREDVAVTRRLISAGELLGIPLLDHVVVGEAGFVSMRSRMDFAS